MSVISDPEIQKAVASIKQRSEKQRDPQKLIESFVDFGIIPQIASENNQVIYGRRGTGKTHLLGFLAAELSARESVQVISIDCRTLGSSRQFSDATLSMESRCLALFRDILAEVHDGLLEYIVEHPTERSNQVLSTLSDLERSTLEPLSDVRVSSRAVTTVNSSEHSEGLNATLSVVKASGDLSLGNKTTDATTLNETDLPPGISTNQNWSPLVI